MNPCTNPQLAAWPVGGGGSRDATGGGEAYGSQHDFILCLSSGSTDFLCFNAYMGNIVADNTYVQHPAVGTITSDRDSIEVGTDSTPGHFGDQLMRVSYASETQD